MFILCSVEKPYSDAQVVCSTASTFSSFLCPKTNKQFHLCLQDKSVNVLLLSQEATGNTDNYFI